MTLALGCASGAEVLDGRGIRARCRARGGRSRAGAQDAPALVDDREVLAVSPEMRDFLKINVHRKASGKVKLQELVDAIVSARNFGLEFDEIDPHRRRDLPASTGQLPVVLQLFIAMAGRWASRRTSRKWTSRPTGP